MIKDGIVTSYCWKDWTRFALDQKLLYKERHETKHGLRGKVVQVSCDSGLARVTKDLAQSIEAIFFWHDQDFYGYDLLDPYKEVFRYSPHLLLGLFTERYQPALDHLEDEVDRLWKQGKRLTKDDLNRYFDIY